MKIRTDFVTNSSSSSFTVQIDVTLKDGNAISFKNTSDAGEAPGVYESVFVSLSPKEMGETESIEALIELLNKNVKGNVWSDEEQKIQKESVFKEDSASKPAKSFLKKLRALNSMDEIKSIHVSGTEMMDKVDHTDVTYDLQEKAYTGERYGHAFDEYPNGGCGGGFSLPDEDQCDLTQAVSFKGEVICELCGQTVKPERAYFAKNESGDFYRFCSKDCCDEVLSWFGDEDAWKCGGLDLIKSLESKKEDRSNNVSVKEDEQESESSEEEKREPRAPFGQSGMDESVNAFCATKDLVSLAKLFLVGSIKQSGATSDVSENGYVETIDVTDTPVTMKLIADKTAGKVTAKVFIRDPEKSEAPALRKYVREWAMTGDRLILDSNEVLKEIKADEWYLHFIGALALRIYLQNTGILSRLKELKGKGFGVGVSVAGEEVVATIVQGKERPALPCADIVLGTITVRPYVDELLQTAAEQETPAGIMTDSAMQENGDEKPSSQASVPQKEDEETMPETAIKPEATAEEEKTVYQEMPEEIVADSKKKNGKYQLSYSKGIRCGDETYSIAIPDNFRLKKGAEGRAFIAYLPNSSDEDLYGDIIFYDGNDPTKLDIDSRGMTPDYCCALAENMFWSNPMVRMICPENKFIPLNEQRPAGGIYAGYDNDCFHYNMHLFFPNGVKTMRVMVMNAAEKDRAACDEMVINWIKTMRLSVDYGELKALNDPGFFHEPLTDSLIKEWEEASKLRFSTITATLQTRIQARGAKYRAEIANGDTESAVRADCKEYAVAAADEVAEYLKSAVNGLERIKKMNPADDRVKQLFETVEPVFKEGCEVSISIDGGKSHISAPIPGFDGVRERYLALNNDAELPETEEKQGNPPFKAPTYNEKRQIVVGAMAADLPDHMVTLDDAVPGPDCSEEFLDQLRSRYAVVALPDDFEKGFGYYSAGAFCINIVHPQTAPQIGVLFDRELQKKAGIEMDLPENLKNIVVQLLQKNGKYNEKYPVEYVCGSERFGIVFAQTDGVEDPLENWASYAFFVFQESNIIQGNVYINCVGKTDEFETAVKTWLRSFRMADDGQIEKYAKKQKKEALGELIAADDEIDAVKVTQLFFDDVAFMNDDEVEFDGKHHTMQKLQFNSEVISKYPGIFANRSVIWPEIFKVVSAIEQDENLIIPKELYHKNLAEVAWNQPITGTTLFHLCAQHMIKIVEQAENTYLVALDSNLILGIPQAYDYIAAFIQSLRGYNGKTGEFSVTIASMGNLNGGISKDIQKAVPHAAMRESMKQLSISEDAKPFFGVCEGILEQRREQEEKQKEGERKKEEIRLKKEAEEKEQYQAAYAVYEQDHAAWERTLAEIKEKRDRFIGETQAAIRDSAEQTLKSRKDKAVNTLTNYLNAAVKYREQLQSQRDALGLFKMREKQELKDKIEDIDAKIQEARDNLQKTVDQYDNRESFIQQHVNKKMKEKEEEINQKFVFPEEPQKPQKPDSMLQRERQAAKERVPQVFAPGEKLSLMALRQKDPLFKSYTSMEFKQLLQELCDENRLERIAESGEQRYRLPQPEQKRKSATVGHTPQKAQRTLTKTQIVNEGIKADILETMKVGTANWTASDVKTLQPNFSEIPLPKIVALMRQLVSEGKLEKITENGEECYRLLQPKKDWESQKTQRTPTKTQLENNALKSEILATMRPGQSYLISEMMAINPSFAEYPSQKIIALMRQLVSEGKLKREVIQGKAYFSLLQDAKNEPYDSLLIPEDTRSLERQKRTPTDVPLTPTQLVNESLKAEILEAMRTGYACTLSVFLELNPNLAEYPSQKIIALMRQLVNEGKLKREVLQGKAYFSII